MANLNELEYHNATSTTYRRASATKYGSTKTSAQSSPATVKASPQPASEPTKASTQPRYTTDRPTQNPPPRTSAPKPQPTNTGVVAKNPTTTQSLQNTTVQGAQPIVQQDTTQKEQTSPAGEQAKGEELPKSNMFSKNKTLVYTIGGIVAIGLVLKFLKVF